MNGWLIVVAVFQILNFLILAGINANLQALLRLAGRRR